VWRATCVDQHLPWRFEGQASLLRTLTPLELMRVRLTQKLSESIDGIDLSHLHVGAVVEVTRREAELLIAEGWAAQDRSHHAGCI
jgi:hypothetical protein